MLAKERQLVVHELLKENTECTLGIKDFEIVVGPIPNQSQTTTSKSRMSTVSTESYQKKDPMPPFGETGREKYEEATQVEKKRR